MTKLFKRYLEPSETMSELLFGLIMTLTFTLGAALVIEEGPEATKELLIGVIGCNIAWGLIDGLLYVFNSMYSRGLPFRAARWLKQMGSETVGKKLEEHLDEAFAEALSTETKNAVCKEVIDHLSALEFKRIRITRDDWWGAFASFLLVVATAIPAVLPFLFIDDLLLALRISNLLLIALLYFIGYQWASYINANRQHIGLSMALGGLVLVQITIMLGG